MSNKSLDIYQNNGSVSRSNSNVSVGTSSSVKGLTWGGRAETFNDLPTIFRPGATVSTELVLRKESKERQSSTEIALARPENIRTPYKLPANLEKTVIASGVRKLDKPLKIGNRIVQRKIGWKATPTTIIIVTVERELEWREDRKLIPITDWLIENRRRFISQGGPATKRVGVVKESPNKRSVSVEESNLTYVESTEEINDAFKAGASTMSYLPIEVRGDIVSQVRKPTYFDGRLLGQPDRSGNMKEYHVDLLRMDDEVALVIKAVKPVDSDAWNVTQAKYYLTTPEIESA